MCLTYSITKDFICDSAMKIVGMSPVSYKKKPLSKFFKKYKLDPSADLADFTIDVMKRVLTVKSPDWKYEGEGRIVRTEPGKMPIPPEFLKQVCFGLRTNSADIDRVRKAANSTNPKTIFTQMIRSNSEFGFEITEI
jgi:hypothetical protein